MSDHDYMGGDRRGRLAADVTMLMLKGAGWAAIVVFGLWIGIWLLSLVGGLLPDERLDTPDPNVRLIIEAPLQMRA
ncbi:MAG: RC-LH1 core complex protein PufX [Paracoccaceae bacterium]